MTIFSNVEMETINGALSSRAVIGFLPLAAARKLWLLGIAVSSISKSNDFCLQPAEGIPIGPENHGLISLMLNCFKLSIRRSVICLGRNVPLRLFIRLLRGCSVNCIG